MANSVAVVVVVAAGVVGKNRQNVVKYATPALAHLFFLLHCKLCFNEYALK